MPGLHALTDEHSRLRRWSLYIFARYLERPLLGWSYRLLRGRWKRWGANPVVRNVLGWGVAAPFGYLGDTARPVPFPRVLEMVERLEGPIAVGPCRCRSAHRDCPHPLETDIVIRTGVAAWMAAFPAEYRLIGRDEAAQIITECHQLGMWQMVFVHCPINQANEYVICNCCTCGCVPYILNRELGQHRYRLLLGDLVSQTDLERCVGRGACVAACPFAARRVIAGQVQMVGPCFGCGLCMAACPESAIRMVARHPSFVGDASDVRAQTV